MSCLGVLFSIDEEEAGKLKNIKTSLAKPASKSKITRRKKKNLLKSVKK